MDIEILFGSKTKCGILKYLIFKRQGVSIRALENELNWSFAAIKKQVDILVNAGVIYVDKTDNKWSIFIKDDVLPIIKQTFLYSLELKLKKIFATYPTIVNNYYLGKVFGKNIDVDMVLVYYDIDEEIIGKVKEEISSIFSSYFLESVRVVFMQADDFNRRYRLADKFVLNLITNS